ERNMRDHLRVWRRSGRIQVGGLAYHPMKWGRFQDAIGGNEPCLRSQHFFQHFWMSPPLAGFCKAAAEVLRRGPGPLGLWVHGRAENILILFAFAFRPGFDEQEKLGA